MSEAIPDHILAAVGRAAHFRLLALINEQFAYSGITPEQLATRLGWSRRRVTRTMAGRQKLTLRAAAELCWAIDGSTIEFSMIERSSPPSPPTQKDTI